jgi:hypothetical protein
MHYRSTTFGRKRPTYTLDLAKITCDACLILGIAASILTALFIHGAAIIVAVGLAVPLIMED